jgi:fibronectin type 3 domain-containing protein
MRLLVAIIIFSLVYIPFDVEVVFAQSDTDAPDITNVKIGTVNDTSVTVTWETDEKADSLVNYGLQEDYGIVRVPTVDRTQHSITLDNLDSGRVYYFRVVSADEEGNQGISADYKQLARLERKDKDRLRHKGMDRAHKLVRELVRHRHQQ